MNRKTFRLESDLSADMHRLAPTGSTVDGIQNEPKPQKEQQTQFNPFSMRFKVGNLGFFTRSLAEPVVTRRTVHTDER